MGRWMIRSNRSVGGMTRKEWDGTERKNLPRIRSNQIKRRPSLYKTLNTKNMNNGEQTNIPRQGTRQGHTHDS
eukprot:jgi/Psemu1/265110/estExt_Genewise1Plus.C_33970001